MNSLIMHLSSFVLLLPSTLISASPAPNGNLITPPPQLTCIDNAQFKGDTFLPFTRQDADNFIRDFCAAGFTMIPDGQEQDVNARRYAGLRGLENGGLAVGVKLSDCGDNTAGTTDISELFCNLQLARMLDECDTGLGEEKYGGQLSVPVSLGFAFVLIDVVYGCGLICFGQSINTGCVRYSVYKKEGDEATLWKDY